MSIYLKSKPRWCQNAKATEQGWVNPLNGELLVSYRGLKSKIDANLVSQAKDKVVMQVQEEVKVETKPVEAEKEVVMQVYEEVKVETKPVEVKEETIKKPKKKQKLLGEVVEFNLSQDSKVIGE